MNIVITSNIKKYFNTSIDFVDHYWINKFEKKINKLIIIPNSESLSKNIIINNKFKIDLIILPGGSDVFEKTKFGRLRFKIEIKLLKFAIVQKIPVLGICRGMQLINTFFGGNLSKVTSHMKTQHLIYFKQKLIFKKKTLAVNSFHNYAIKENDVGKDLKIIATDKNANVEIFKHKSHKIIGVMFHPERFFNDYYLKKLLNFFI